MHIVNTIAQGLGLTFTPEKTSTVIPEEAGIHVDLKQNQKMDSRFHGNDEQTFAPIDLLDYIYAALHSPCYRETYKAFLKIDFPRVPYAKNAEALGGELRKTHLLETAANSTMSYPVSGNHVVGKLRYEDSKVYINETQYFDHVPALAWNFYIGGYQPAQKWLKDRKDRALTLTDIQHYQRIIHALCETDRLMQAVDKVFEA